MNGMNKVFIMGYLGTTPTTQIAKNGESYTRLRIATNRFIRGADGAETKIPEWHSVRVWGKQAESCSKYLQKGSGVMVEGYISSFEATRDNGEKDRRVGINAIKVDFLTPSGAGGASLLRSPPPA